MVQVTNQLLTRQDVIAKLLSQQSKKGSDSPTTQINDSTYKPKGREINDTISLSSGAKIVNIGRGYELAEQVRNEKDPTKLRELIRAGGEDIRRIGRLFFEVGRSISSFFARPR